MKNLLYSTFTGSKATRYGITNEDTAIEEYVTRQREKEHHNLAVRKSGLVNSADNPWLAASPDGVVKDPSNCVQSPAGLVEIKNPYSAKNLTIAERTLKKCCKSQCSSRREIRLSSIRSTYQIQTQMNCANADWCDFVVRTEADMHIECTHAPPTPSQSPLTIWPYYHVVQLSLISGSATDTRSQTHTGHILHYAHQKIKQYSHCWVR